MSAIATGDRYNLSVVLYQEDGVFKRDILTHIFTISHTLYTELVNDGTMKILMEEPLHMSLTNGYKYIETLINPYAKIVDMLNAMYYHTFSSLSIAYLKYDDESIHGDLEIDLHEIGLARDHFLSQAQFYTRNGFVMGGSLGFRESEFFSIAKTFGKEV